jgi:lysozyme family protein
MAKVSYTPAIKAELEKKWATLRITKDRPGIEKVARRLIANKARYQTVSRSTGVPWWFIAVIHQREASGDFGCVLHNGERIVGTNKVTSIVPKGRGPFATWEAAAIDALSVAPHKLNTNRDWSIGRSLYEIEKFNGFGYRLKGKPSPYVFSHTQEYSGGKYIRDHVYDADVYDAQYGAAAVLKAMQSMGVDLGPSSNVPGAVVIGGVAAAFATGLPVIFVVAALGVGGWFLYRYLKRRRQQASEKTNIPGIVLSTNSEPAKAPENPNPPSSLPMSAPATADILPLETTQGLPTEVK